MHYIAFIATVGAILVHCGCAPESEGPTRSARKTVNTNTSEQFSKETTKKETDAAENDKTTSADESTGSGEETISSSEEHGETMDETGDNDSSKNNTNEDAVQAAPIASFPLTLPSTNALASVTFPIVADGALSYRSKVIEGNANCGPISSFGAAVSMSEPLTITPTKINGTAIKVCVVAVGQGNLTQTTPTSMNWSYQTGQVTLLAHNIPSGESSATSITPYIYPSATSVMYKVGSDDTCATASGYSTLTQAIDISDLADGDIFLCLIGTTESGTQTAARATKYRWKKVPPMTASAGNASGHFTMKALRLENCDKITVKVERIVGDNIVKSETKPCNINVGGSLTFNEMCHANNSCLKITFTNNSHIEKSMPSPTSCFFQAQMNHNSLRIDVDTNGGGAFSTCKPNEDEIFIASCSAGKKLNLTNCQ